MLSEDLNSLLAADKLPVLCSKTPQAYTRMIKMLIVVLNFNESIIIDMTRKSKDKIRLEHSCYLKAPSSTFSR